MKIKILISLNILAYITLILFNFLANSLPIGGRSTGEISAMYTVLVTPASYAFSIWGLIYFLLAGFVILQAVPQWRNEQKIRQIGPWFIVNSALNCLWIVLWHHLYITSSVFVMIAILLSLIIIYLKIRDPREIQNLNMNVKLRFALKLDYFFVILPFSIYLGWISVASIVNISIGLSASNWNGWGVSESIWAIVVLGVAFLLALRMLHKFHDKAFVLVVIWALIAIGMKQHDTLLVAYSSWGLALLLLLVMIWKTRKVY